MRVRLRKHEDPRPESYRPDQESFQLGEVLSSERAWQARRTWLLPTVSGSMCEILRRQAETAKSLGMFKPSGEPALVVEKADRDWSDMVRQLDLFEAPAKTLEPIPYRFKYRYRCDEPACRGHEQSIVDWEACELYRKLKASEETERAVFAKMEEKFVGELWARSRDSYLFVGNQMAHPRSFIVLGVFWPPRTEDPRQLRLL